MRNGVWGWSLDRQRTALAGIGVEPRRIFVDVLPAIKASHPSRVHPKYLKERAALLRPTGRKVGDVIHVATLLVLGCDEVDLIASLAAASERRDSVQVAGDGGYTYPFPATPLDTHAAVREWQRARLVEQTGPARAAGTRAASDAKRKRTEAGLVIARPLWSLPWNWMSSDDISEQSGLSIVTLHRRLGDRGKRKPLPEDGPYSAKEKARAKRKA